MSHTRLTASRLFAMDITKAVLATAPPLLEGLKLDARLAHLDIKDVSDGVARCIELRFKVYGSEVEILAVCYIYQEHESWYFPRTESDPWVNGRCNISFPEINPDEIWTFDCERREDDIKVELV